MRESKVRLQPVMWSVTDAEVAAVVTWWTAHGRDLPWRHTRDVYAVWVAEVMAVQTTVTRAAEAWLRWMERWPTVESLAAASLADVLRTWQGLGYPRRARDLHRAAQQVAASGWPHDLTELPGTGTYVAAAVRCFALEEPVLPLDVNVSRVIHRRFPGGIDITGDAWRTGQALMEFGQRICSARPRCEACPVSRGCAGRGSPAAVGRRRRPARFHGSVRQRRGQLLRRVLASGAVRLDEEDAEIAAGLAADGLIVLSDGVAHAPE